MYIFKIIKNTIYKVIYKNIFTKVIFWNIGYWKKIMYTYLFKKTFTKFDCKWLITKTLYTHILLRFSIQSSITVCQAIIFLKEHQWMVTISSFLKKWRVSFVFCCSCLILNVLEDLVDLSIDQNTRGSVSYLRLLCLPDF